MNLFKRKKSPDPDIHSDLLASLAGHSTASSKLKSFLKPKPVLPPQLPVPAPRRVSTIVENDSEDSEETDTESESESESDESESDESDESDYEPHSHKYLSKDRTATVSQLLQLMGLWGLAQTKELLEQAANEELRRTYSLLSEKLKIVKMLASTNRHDPKYRELIIQEHQARLIVEILLTLAKVLDCKDKKCVNSNKSLYERYGVVTDVIGRGSYGVIKLIKLEHQLLVYAVKEITRHGKEATQKFTERAISEFVVLLALNNRNIVKVLDLMVTPSDSGTKLNLVMELSGGGDLFSYIKKAFVSKEALEIEEIDCMAKQAARGLAYMHSHGVAHCDVKLENILISWEGTGPRRHMTLKHSDFGKSNVFRTAWDREEQAYPLSSGPVGLEPYLAPEEHGQKGTILLPKKDCWAYGVLVLTLWNVRRAILANCGDTVQLEYTDGHGEKDTQLYPSGYLWRRTDQRHGHWKDAVFGEFCRSAMDASYDADSREWTVRRRGQFLPIETLFSVQDGIDESALVLRRWFCYQLLSTEPKRRVSMEGLLRSDWLRNVECCK